jgi:hypothetical protein
MTGLKHFNGYYSSNLSQRPFIFLMHYAFVASLIEPAQAVADMHTQACEIALRSGDKAMFANHKYFLFTRQVHSGKYFCDRGSPLIFEYNLNAWHRKTTGTNLHLLKEELELVLKTTTQNTWPVLGMRLHLKMIRALTEGSSSTLEEKEDESIPTLYLQILFHQMIVNTYIGYFDRVKHLAEKFSSLSNDFKKTFNLRHMYVAFYYALSILVTRRNKKTNAKKLPKEFDQMLGIVADASTLSRWNFENKITLLLAEQLSTICLIFSMPKTCSEYAEAGE